MSATIQSKPKLPGFISLLLVIALGISLAKLMWLLLTPPPKISTSFSNETNSLIKPKAQINYGKLIADQHIFGEVKIEPVAVVEKKPEIIKKEVVAPTKLNLKLHGIVAYKSKGGFALISASNGPQKVYSKGETIQEGVIVSDILPEKVVLDNLGKTEELLLPVNKVTPSSRRRTNNIPLRNVPLPGSESQQKKLIRSPLATANSAAPNLSKLREDIISNPTKLMDVVRPSPAIVDGQFIGFRIRPGKQRKMFNQLNFRSNDIITEVNGIVLDDQNKGAMVLSELSQAANISVKVKRGNQELMIDHSF